ncbi:MAG TPA: XdhC family protein [Ilumatobacteraceae bacterium]|nr:XdhC family protein [Ilumatobacteraceae bacterium]
MYRIALSVAACLRAATEVHVAWIVETHGCDELDRSDAVAITPGGGRIGSLASGALDGQLSDRAGTVGDRGRLVDLHISEVDALIAGLSQPCDARCLLVPAAALPGDLWEKLIAREPVCLVTRLEGDEVLDTALFDAATISAAGETAAQLFAGRTSAAAFVADAVVSVFWSVPQLVVVGGGPVGEALVKAAGLLGWQTQIANDVATAAGLIAGLAGSDSVVVAAHDVDVAGPALAAALDSDAGYIGALGARRMQQARADWLAYRDITDLGRIHGPAGLAIGADTPAEIALSILAEAVAVRSGSGGR